MSSTLDSTVQTGAYAVERTKQEAGAAYNDASKVADSTTSNLNTGSLQAQYNAAADQTARAANDFQATASVKTNEAVAEGKHDVGVVQAQGASYVQQAKTLASDALGTAQSYVAAGQAKITPAEGTTGIVNSIQTTAATALETTKGYLASAQSMVAPAAASAAATLQSGAVATANTLQSGANATMAAAQPHVDAARAAVQPHVETVQQAAQPHIDTVSGYVVPKMNAASAAVQPHLDAATAAIQPHVDAASAAIQPHVETVKSAVLPKVEQTKAVTKANLDKFNQQTLVAPDLKPTLSTTAIDGHSTVSSIPPSVPPKPYTANSDFQRAQDLKLSSPEGTEAVLKMGA